MLFYLAQSYIVPFRTKAFIVLMQTDYIIVGKGIAGTLLSYQLLKKGKQVVVVDDDRENIASKVAGAVINPCTGKYWNPAPQSDIFIPAAVQCYREMEQLLKSTFLHEMPMFVFSDHQLQIQLEEVSDEEKNRLEKCFTAPAAIFKINNVFLVAAAELLDNWTNYLLAKGMFRRETFYPDQCQASPHKVQYKDIEAKKIIFCEGAAGANNTFFQSLPFTRNRGEALLLSIPQLSSDAVYHHKLRLVPRGDGFFWYGSNYQWTFDDLSPDMDWKKQALEELNTWLKIPFEIVDHIVAERPTTAGQIPLVGVHPKWPSVAIFNGLGTRGFSSGPYWSEELSKKLSDDHYQIRNYNEAWLNNKFR